MTSKLRRTAISLEDKYAILKMVSEKNLSYDQIGTHFKISKSTIAGIVRNREKYEHTNDQCVKRKKIRCGDYPEIDKAIVIWLKSMRHAGISINGNLFKKKAQQFAENLNISDFCASDGWLDRCKKRNSITFRDIVGESASVSPEMYSEWINFKLPSILQKYESRDVFNLDETSLFYKLMPNKTLSFKNETCSGGKLSKERVTVLLGANSDGSDKLPILVIGKYAKPRVFKNVKTLPLLYSANKKAWMTSSEWEKYVNCLEKKFKKESRHVVFIIDNAPSHLPIEKLQNIEIIYLPPNTTAICQPLDQGIIRNFKLFYRNLFFKMIKLCFKWIKLILKQIKLN